MRNRGTATAPQQSSHVRRHRHRRRREAGIGTLESVGIFVIASVLVAAVVTPVSAKAPEVTATIRCLIERLVNMPDDHTCGGGADDDPGDGPGEGEGEGDGEGDGPVDPTNPGGPDGPILNPDDPDDERCKDALPSSGAPLDPQQPTYVQVGCRGLFVPEDCKAEWEAYDGAADETTKAEAAEPLGTCVRDTYARIEPTCVTKSNSEADRREVKFLFIKLGDSDGMMVEELGDGRVRIHLLRGTEFGGEFSASGKGVDFSVGGVTGYEDGTTYEFHEMQKAQDWLDWYQQYRNIDANIAGLNQASLVCPRPGTCQPNPVHQQQVRQLMEKKKELKETEPEHHDLATSSVRTSKFKLSGGVSFPVKKKQGNGEGGITPGISGDYTGEVQVEQRDWKDGSMTATYKSTDVGGFLIGAKATGGATKNKKGGKEGEKEDVGGGKGGDALGAEWSGNSTTSVTWNPDGKLGKLILTFDQQAMDSINKAGIDLSVALPYGFGLSGSYSHQTKEGKSTVTEMILDFDQHPELREKLGPHIDQMFPRNDDGDLEKGDVELNFDDSPDADDPESDPVRSVLDDSANVRDLEYDVKEVEDTASVGVDFVGIDLFKSTWTHVESEKTLRGSSFEVTDVNGDRKTVRPAPKCKDLPFEQPDDYYTGDFSDPPVAKLF